MSVRVASFVIEHDDASLVAFADSKAKRLQQWFDSMPSFFKIIQITETVVNIKSHNSGSDAQGDYNYAVNECGTVVMIYYSNV